MGASMSSVRPLRPANKRSFESLVSNDLLLAGRSGLTLDMLIKDHLKAWFLT